MCRTPDTIIRLFVCVKRLQSLQVSISLTRPVGFAICEYSSVIFQSGRYAFVCSAQKPHCIAIPAVRWKRPKKSKKAHFADLGGRLDKGPANPPRSAFPDTRGPCVSSFVDAIRHERRFVHRGYRPGRCPRSYDSSHRHQRVNTTCAHIFISRANARVLCRTV